METCLPRSARRGPPPAVFKPPRVPRGRMTGRAGPRADWEQSCSPVCCAAFCARLVWKKGSWGQEFGTVQTGFKTSLERGTCEPDGPALPAQGCERPTLLLKLLKDKSGRAPTAPLVPAPLLSLRHSLREALPVPTARSKPNPTSLQTLGAALPVRPALPGRTDVEPRLGQPFAAGRGARGGQMSPGRPAGTWLVRTG